MITWYDDYQMMTRWVPDTFYRYIFFIIKRISCFKSVQNIENLAQSYEIYQSLIWNFLNWKWTEIWRKNSKAYNFLQGVVKRAIFIGIMRP